MKKILLLLLIPMIVLGQSSTRTTNFRLPQWGTGDTLKAGTKDQPNVSNYSLNNGFARLDSILGVAHNEWGFHTGITSPAGSGLAINPGSGTDELLYLGGLGESDSVHVYGNIAGDGNLIITGNITSAGYISVDSLSSTSGNLWISGDLSVGDDITVSDDLTAVGQVSSADTLKVGATGVDAGIIAINNASGLYTVLKGSASSSTKSVTFANRTGTVALQTGNDSVQAPTISHIIYSMPVSADSSADDTVDTELIWFAGNDKTQTKVLCNYVHKQGIKYVTAYREEKYPSSDIGRTSTLWIGSLSGGASDPDVHADYTAHSTSVDVSGLTPDGLYQIKFTMTAGTGADGYYVRRLVIMAESQ